jgi:hypothetical protein
LLLIWYKLKPIIFGFTKEMTDSNKDLAASVVGPLGDALCKVFHSSSKLNNGINLMEERIGKLEKQELDHLAIIDGMGAELSLVLDNVSILDSKLDGTIRLLKTATEGLSKQLTQLVADINNLTNVSLKKKQ